MNILLIEDNHSLVKNIATFLEAKGHRLDFSSNGEQGLQLALENFYDVIVLDLGLPKLDGITVCSKLRSQSARHIPVLMLTSRDTIDDKVTGFSAGTDDYLTKPFVLEELEIRCIALSKRHLLHSESQINLGPLVLDRKTQEVFREGQLVDLKQVGYRIVEILAEAHPRKVSRSELVEKIWGDEPTESDALRSHIYQLRTLLDKPFAKPLIKTIHGVGFALDIEE